MGMGVDDASVTDRLRQAGAENAGRNRATSLGNYCSNTGHCCRDRANTGAAVVKCLFMNVIPACGGLVRVRQVTKTTDERKART